MNYKEMNNIKKIEKDVSGILTGLINEDDSNYNSIKREILAKVYELYKINSYIAMKLLDIYVVAIYNTITLGNSEDKIIEDKSKINLLTFYIVKLYALRKNFSGKTKKALSLFDDFLDLDDEVIFLFTR